MTEENTQPILTNSKEVRDYCSANKLTATVLAYKGGFAVVINGRINSIFAGKETSEAEALAELEKLTAPKQ